MKFHLIGICGTGMGSLAGLLVASGHEVRGSDEHVYPPMSTQLAQLGVLVYRGFAPANLDWSPDRVVVGNVCRRDHVEVAAAQERGLQLTSFPAVLEEVYLGERHSLVVAGTHGKTTTASLAASILFEAGRDPGYLIGGVPVGLGQGYRLGGSSSPFVVEGDEYDTAFFDKGSKFFHYRPRTAILTSVELDHVDIFASLEAVKAAFRKFVALLPSDGLLVVCADSPSALECADAARCRIERYRVMGREDEGGEAEWTARAGASERGRRVFEVARAGSRWGRFETGLIGDHNLANALGVIAALAGLGLGADEIAGGLARFAGVRRRQELKGLVSGIAVVDDFAHHPTAVRETLAGLRGHFGPGRLLALFEPRSASSRRAVFQEEYAAAFRVADEVLIAPVFAPEKAPPGDRLDPEQLAASLRQHGLAARHLPTIPAIADYVAAHAREGDTIVAMSSGSFGGVHDLILERLARRSAGHV